MNHVWDFYQREQKRKEEGYKSNQIFLHNQQLQHILKPLLHKIDRKNYEKEEREANRMCVQCSIWDLKYRNNFENPKVAITQANFISLILEREAIENKNYLKQETERIMYQLQHVYPHTFQYYKRGK